MEGTTTDAAVKNTAGARDSARAASTAAAPRDGGGPRGWQARLAAGDTLVVDGGTGSELRRRGMQLHPQAWSALAALTHYDLLRAVHFDYIAAGADVV